MADDPVTNDSGSEQPGMQAALATLQSSYWRSRPAKSPLEQNIDKLKWYYTNDVLAPLFNLVDKVKITAQNPATLVSAWPMVQKMRVDRAVDELTSIPEGQDLFGVLDDRNKVMIAHKSSSSQLLANIEFTDGGVTMSSDGIMLAGKATHGRTVALLAHELQHQRQLEAGILNPLSDKVPSPVERVWYDRAVEADAQATAVEMAWKLKETGKPAAWNALTSFEEPGNTIAKAYEKQALADPKSVDDGRAKRAAFDEWFVTKTRLGYSFTQLYNNWQVEKVIDAEKLEKLTKAGKPLAPLTVGDFEKLGELSSVNYLTLPGARPLDDPYYRKADWNSREAYFLAGQQAEYDTFKAGAKSKFIAPQETPAEAAPAETIAQAPRARVASAPGMKV